MKMSLDDMNQEIITLWNVGNLERAIAIGQDAAVLAEKAYGSFYASGNIWDCTFTVYNSKHVSGTYIDTGPVSIALIVIHG